MQTKWNVMAVALGIAIWFGLGAGSALADADGFIVHCVDVTFLDGRFGDCDDQHPLGIQDGVNHAESGETVLVGVGMYPEQVKIIRPLTLEGAAGMTSIIQPAVFIANTSNIINGAPIAAIVLADGTTGVSVSEFTVDGMFASGCSAGLVGVFYRGSSGSIEDNHVTNIAQGCNNALGIFVQTDKGGKTKADVAILSNVVERYGKNGITANQAGTFITVNGNTVTGDSTFTPTPTGPVCVPPKSDIVQNGVQVGYAARGRVTGNTISNHCYTPDTFVACGTLFFKAGGGPGRAQTNIFSGNEGNICNVQGTIGSAHSPFNEQ